MHLPYQEYKNPQASHRNLRFFTFLHFYILHFYIVATQLVAPSAVTIAVAIDAIICTINFNVSFLLIIFNVLIVSLVRLASPRMFNV